MECAIFLWPISRFSIFFLWFDHTVLPIFKNETKTYPVYCFLSFLNCILMSFVTSKNLFKYFFCPFSFSSPFGILITDMFDGFTFFHSSWLLCSTFFKSLSLWNLVWVISITYRLVHYFFSSAILSLWWLHQRYSSLYCAVYFCHHYFNQWIIGLGSFDCFVFLPVCCFYLLLCVSQNLDLEKM